MKSPTQRLLLLIVGVLLIPIVPFILLGSWFEPWLETLLAGTAIDASPPLAFGSVVGILAIDILLPIPSSAVCTFAGKQLGGATGTVACWIGLNLSAGIGYWIGAAYGRPIAVKFSDEETLKRLESFDKRSSIVCLVLCRSLPIIAEASVLLMGMKKLSWTAFWPAVLLSNLGIAAALCWLGAFSAKANWFPLAMGISVAVPLLFVLFWKAKR
ncbi:TVP38/TMEM64 family protein [Mariniblastus fucicola]|nr:VTT domain-containing protein [Mariniblastus fucicola]